MSHDDYLYLCLELQRLQREFIQICDSLDASNRIGTVVTCIGEADSEKADSEKELNERIVMLKNLIAHWEREALKMAEVVSDFYLTADRFMALIRPGYKNVLH